MSDYRVEVTGGEAFNPREWLRREVLWAYLVVPYSRLYQTWFNNTALSYHDSNLSRRDFFAKENEPGLSFFNHGKAISSLLHQSLLFKAMRSGQRVPYVNILKLQAGAVDRALTTISAIEPDNINTQRVFEECEAVARTVHFSEYYSYSQSMRLFKASNLMGRLAAGQIQLWLEQASPYDTDETLVIDNGGVSRSSGPNIDRLAPIFQQIVAGERFQELRQ